MTMSTVICVFIAFVIILASSEDIADLKAKQIAVRSTLARIRIEKKLQQKKDLK